MIFCLHRLLVAGGTLFSGCPWETLCVHLWTYILTVVFHMMSYKPLVGILPNLQLRLSCGQKWMYYIIFTSKGQRPWSQQVQMQARHNDWWFAIKDPSSSSMLYITSSADLTNVEYLVVLCAVCVSVLSDFLQCPTWGRGIPFPSCLFLSSYFAFLLFPFLGGFNYFLLSSIPSLSARIVPLRFQVVRSDWTWV